MLAPLLISALLGQAAPSAASPYPVLEKEPGLVHREKWGEEILCGYVAKTPEFPSGQFRVQCDKAAKICWAAPTHVIGPDGVETSEEVSRVQPCTQTVERWGDWTRQGYRFVQAVPDVQPGWIRDERGRAMQYNFDLDRRVYLGAGAAPTYSTLDYSSPMRPYADFGVSITSLSDDEHALYRWTVLETELYGGLPTAESTLVRFDWSSMRDRPVLWVTTFVGKPRRHDVNLDIGGWFEALHLEALQRGGENETFLTLGAAQATIDLWHSRDLVSFLRVRGGPAAELDTNRHFTALKPEVAVEGNFTLDRDGFHHLHFLAEGEKLLFAPAVSEPLASRPQNPERLRLRAGYEVIFIAINDQPVTLVAEGRGTWRDDFLTVGPGWEWSGQVGLRFSLWAPARRSAPVERM